MNFWDSFIPQLLATLVGGIIGVFGVWLAFRWQRTAAARDGVDAAVENLLLRITHYVSDAQAYRSEYQMTNWARGGTMRRTFPHVSTVSIACELLRLRTAGDERAAADLINETWDLIANSGQKIIGLSGLFAGAISQWRLTGSADHIIRLRDAVQTAVTESGDDEQDG